MLSPRHLDAAAVHVAAGRRIRQQHVTRRHKTALMNVTTVVVHNFAQSFVMVLYLMAAEFSQEGAALTTRHVSAQENSQCLRAVLVSGKSVPVYSGGTMESPVVLKIVPVIAHQTLAPPFLPHPAVVPSNVQTHSTFVGIPWLPKTCLLIMITME